MGACGRLARNWYNLRTRAMKTLRTATLILAGALLAFLWVELGLRGAALAWRLCYRSCSRPAAFPVYVVGESTAYGEPFAPKISFPSIVSLMFGGRLRGKPLEIVNLARPGSNTEAQYWQLLRELALRPRPEGIVLIYVGINETLSERPPSRGALLADRSLLWSRLSGMLRSHGLGLDYEHRLAKLLALARGCGYPVVVSTLVGNVRDFQPGFSRELRQDPIRSAAYERARREEALGRWRAAAQIYADLAAGGGPNPGIIHREARCRLELGQYAQARELFQRAADQGSTKRPTTAQDQAIRRLAARCGAALADSRAVFAAAAPQGLPGYDLFMDAHHPNLRGYLLLARAFAREISRLLDAPVVRGGLSEAEVRSESGFSARDESGVAATRFLWFCGEAFHRGDPEEPLRMARRYLGQAERGTGRRLPAYRFLLALLARDRAGVARSLVDQDAIRRDRENLGSIGCNQEWTAQLVKDSGLPEALASEAQKIMTFAGGLSDCGRDGAGRGGVSRASPQRRRYRESKTHADQGVSLILSGRGEEGRQELERALRIYPENVEAALSLCTWHSQQEHWDAAWPYCDLAWRAGNSGVGAYSADFLEQCRSAREKARARLHKTQNPPLGGSRS
jgi:tetratricopeptide (TPR) repeat protein